VLVTNSTTAGRDGFSEPSEVEMKLWSACYWRPKLLSA